MELTQKNYKINGATLKIIAIITMFIDHFGAGYYGFLPDLNGNIYFGLRVIGRIAFPIFLFLLIEGYTHTICVKKYLIRLFIFALISEVPFDLMLSGNFPSNFHQNVYFELFIIVVMFYFMDKFENRFLKLIPFIVCGAIAEILNFDYGFFGVIAGFIMYTMGESNKDRAIGTLIGFLFEIQYITPIISAILIYFYNHKRGRQIKYFFYAFYPLHLLLIYFLRVKFIGV